MSEEDKQVVPPQENQEQELEINLDGTEDVEALKAKLAEAEKAKAQILARAKAAEAKLKTASPAVEKTPTPTATINDEVFDLRMDGYTKDEVKFIINNGGRQALDSNPYVKKAVEFMKEQRLAESAIPSNNGAKSDVEKKFTEAQLNNMSVEELLKILPKSNR